MMLNFVLAPCGIQMRPLELRVWPKWTSKCVLVNSRNAGKWLLKHFGNLNFFHHFWHCSDIKSPNSSPLPAIHLRWDYHEVRLILLSWQIHSNPEKIAMVKSYKPKPIPKSLLVLGTCIFVIWPPAKNASHHFESKENYNCNRSHLGTFDAFKAEKCAEQHFQKWCSFLFWLLAGIKCGHWSWEFGES